jgi:tetratricopeptide (TPR) repeat protein
MDFLKHTLWVILLMVSLSVVGQDFDRQLKAFANSYDYEQKGNYTAAIRELQAVHQEGDYETSLRLGWLMYLAGRHTESLAYYQKCIDIRPLSAEARFGYVNPAASLGMWQQVAVQYNEILKAEPMNTLANYRLGLMAYEREDFATALKYFDKVINLYPFDYDTAIMVAWTQYRLGKLREARIMFQKALLIKPSDSSAAEGLKLIK